MHKSHLKITNWIGGGARSYDYLHYWNVDTAVLPI